MGKCTRCNVAIRVSGKILSWSQESGVRKNFIQLADESVPKWGSPDY